MPGISALLSSLQRSGCGIGVGPGLYCSVSLLPISEVTRCSSWVILSCTLFGAPVSWGAGALRANVQDSERPLSTHVLQGWCRSHFSLFRQHAIATMKSPRLEALTSFVYKVCRTGLASACACWAAHRGGMESLHSYLRLIQGLGTGRTRGILTTKTALFGRTLGWCLPSRAR